MENQKDINCYSVYMHKNKINNKVYIGITTKENPSDRWGTNGTRYNHNNHLKNAIKKYGWDNFEHIILFKHLTKTEAEEKEIELIAKYNATDKNFGYNIQNGGNSNGKMTDEIKRKIGLANSRSIYQYDRNTGEFINEYCSAAEAERTLGIDKESISSVCRKRIKSIGGYIFRFKSDKLIYGEKLSDEEFIISKNTHFRPVIQYSKSGDFIKEYPSIRDAELAFNKKQGSTLIWHCCNGKKPSALGYIWAYKGEPCVVKQSKKVKPVNQLDKNGNLIQKFESVKAAAESINRSSESVIYACKKENKYLEGYLWEYAS